MVCAQLQIPNFGGVPHRPTRPLPRISATPPGSIQALALLEHFTIQRQKTSATRRDDDQPDDKADDESPPPPCPCLGPRSSTSGATPTSRSSATTRSARPSRPTRPRGTDSPCLVCVSLARDGLGADTLRADKPSATSSATPPSRPAPAPSPSCSSPRCTATPARPRSATGVSSVARGGVFSAISRCQECVALADLCLGDEWLTDSSTTSDCKRWRVTCLV